jgi:hypothetical protein
MKILEPRIKDVLLKSIDLQFYNYICRKYLQVMKRLAAISVRRMKKREPNIKWGSNNLNISTNINVFCSSFKRVSP